MLRYEDGPTVCGIPIVLARAGAVGTDKWLSTDSGSGSGQRAMANDEVGEIIARLSDYA